MSCDGRKEESIEMKMSRDDIMRNFFTPIEQLRREENQATEPWCDLSETRLFQLMAHFKPAGVNKFFNLHAIFIYMNHIYEKEDGCELFLNDEDFETVRERKDLPKSEKTLRFQPRYHIRPSIDQILARVELYWDMKAVEHKEDMPDGFEVHSEFFLPEEQFSELMKEKENENAAQAAATLPTSTLAVKTSVRKRRR